MKLIHYIGLCLLFAIGLAAPAYAEQPEQPKADNKPYFEVAREDVANAVGKALADRGAAEKVRTVVYSKDDVLYSANAPLSVAIQGLKFDERSHKWQANMLVLSKGETVNTTPIQGRYESVYTVPVLTRQAINTDIITDADVEYIDVPERQVRKDTVLNLSDILGKSPKRSISPNRPIRLSEVNMPAIIKKGAAVQINYSAPYMKLQTTGQALEDGSLGSIVRVKNMESQRAISARVISAGVVETNSKQSTSIN